MSEDHPISMPIVSGQSKKFWDRGAERTARRVGKRVCVVVHERCGVAHTAAEWRGGKIRTSLCRVPLEVLEVQLWRGRESGMAVCMLQESEESRELPLCYPASHVYSD